MEKNMDIRCEAKVRTHSLTILMMMEDFPSTRSSSQESFTTMAAMDR